MTFFKTTIAEAAQKMAAGETTCMSETTRCLDLIASKDPGINAFLSVHADAALARARELDGLPQAEKKSRPLFGIPIAVKDNICTRGFETTCASKILKGFIPPYNAAVVEALDKAGAVIVGKTNLDEFAMGSSTENSAFAITRNPHDANRIPGGSSGGSAAAVAAGMVPASLGSDTGGSIRQPSAHCGAVGLKPTYGRISRYGLVAYASSLDQIGPLASDVRDVGLLLEILSTPDERDSTNARKPFVNDPALYNNDIRDLRIGLPREYFGEGLSDGVRSLIEKTAESLRARGAKTVDVSLENVSHAVAAYYIIASAEASSNLARFDGVKYGHRTAGAASLADLYTHTREEGFGAEVKRRIMLGTYVLSSGYYDAYYLKAARVRTLIARDFERAFAACDCILSPVTTAPAFTIGEKASDPLEMYLTDIYTVSANLAGIPGISVPCGVLDGLPVGAQFMAPKWREDVALKAAWAVQNAA